MAFDDVDSCSDSETVPSLAEAYMNNPLIRWLKGHALFAPELPNQDAAASLNRVIGVQDGIYRQDRSSMAPSGLSPTGKLICGQPCLRGPRRRGKTPKVTKEMLIANICYLHVSRRNIDAMIVEGSRALKLSGCNS